jgi:hypothetical protein
VKISPTDDFITGFGFDKYIYVIPKIGAELLSKIIDKIISDYKPDFPVNFAQEIKEVIMFDDGGFILRSDNIDLLITDKAGEMDTADAGSAKRVECVVKATSEHIFREIIDLIEEMWSMELNDEEMDKATIIGIKKDYIGIDLSENWSIKLNLSAFLRH